MASALTHNTSVSALMESWGGSQQQQLTCMAAFSTVRWLFWVSGFGFRRGRGVGKQTLCWGTVSSERAHPKNGFETPEKTQKTKKRKIQKGAQNHQICLVWWVLGGIAKGLSTDEKISGNNAETIQRGGARARVAPHSTALSS